MEFEKAVEIILKFEGGYVNDENDPGGETNFGISKRAYPGLDIKNIRKGHAKLIYEKDYWNACRCSGLPKNIRLMVFDCSVNMGTDRASRFLQMAVGADNDGIVGPQTLNSVEVFCQNYGHEKLIVKYAKLRIMSYSRIKNFKIYGNGWVNRTLEILTECLAE